MSSILAVLAVSTLALLGAMAAAPMTWGSLRHPREDIRKLAMGAKWPWDTPIVIHNRDQLHYLHLQIAQLHGMGYYHIFVLDNGSTYKPLLAFYDEKLTWVVRFPMNHGNEVIWQTNFAVASGLTFLEHLKSFRRFVLTDSDMVFTEQVPDDWLLRFWEILDRYPNRTKVGAALRVDDIPGWYPLRDYVRWSECSHWRAERQLERDVFHAPLDTTFALYNASKIIKIRRQGAWHAGEAEFSLRVAGPYVMRHLPWYEHPRWMLDDVRYAIESRGDEACHGMFKRRLEHYLSSTRGNDGAAPQGGRPWRRRSTKLPGEMVKERFLLRQNQSCSFCRGGEHFVGWCSRLNPTPTPAKLAPPGAAAARALGAPPLPPPGAGAGAAKGGAGAAWPATW